MPRARQQQRWYQSWAGSQGCKEKTKARDDASIRLFARVSAIFSGLIGQKPLEINTLADILEGLQGQPRPQAPSHSAIAFHIAFYKRVVMQRRSFLAVLPLGALLAACSPAVPTQWLIGTETIEAALQRRFPHDLPLAGLLQLSLAQPVLTLHPPTQQIEALLQAALSGPALGKVYTGAVSLRCTLVFDAATASVQAQQVQVQQMRLDGAPEALAQMFSAYGPYVVEHVLQDWPLYTLSAEQQQQLSRLHLAVGDITVHADGLRIALHSVSS